MSSFTSPLTVTLMKTGRHFRLEIPFTYYTDILKDRLYISVPVGYVTDFATTPRMLWSVAPPIGKHSKASVLHDYLYDYGHRKHGINRKVADLIFKEAMEVYGTPRFITTVYYLTVRLFSRRYFKKEF